MGIMQALVGGGPVYLGATREVYNNNSSGTTASIAYPTTAAAGDLLVLYAFDPILADMATDGWTTLASSGGGDDCHHAFAKVAAGGESGSLAYSSRLSNAPYIAALFMVRGWNVTSGATAQASGTLAGVTMSGAGLWLQVAVASQIPGPIFPTGFLEYETRSGTLSSLLFTRPRMSTGYRRKPSGATGTEPYTASPGSMIATIGIGVAG